VVALHDEKRRFSLNQSEIIGIALQLSGFKEVPADTGIQVPGGSIEKPWLSIDVGVGELLMARELGCDSVISHHPLGSTAVNFYEVLARHAQFMREEGIPDAEATPALNQLVSKARLKVHPSIYNQVVEAASRMRMPLMNVHLPCDEIGRHIMEATLSKAGPKVGDLVEALLTLPEYQASLVKPEVALGDPSSKRGRTKLVVAAGTNGGYAIAKAYFTHGIDTLIYMHIDAEELSRLKEDPTSKNLVLLGHESGDSVGINPLVAALRKKGMEPLTVGILGAPP
jgi:putative NIF3 family GTP cyclohydrolase 1 type 2